MSVLENMTLSERKRYAGWGGLSVHWKVARGFVIEALQRFGLRMPALEAQVAASPAATSSASSSPASWPAAKLLVSYYPTRGMDVPSATRSREMLLAHRAQGAAILLVSEDLDELFALSDRLAVTCIGGKSSASYGHQTTTRAVGLLMTGAEEHHGDIAERPRWRVVDVPPALRSPRALEVLRFIGALAVTLVGFGLLLLVQGAIRRRPTRHLGTTLGSAYGRSEVVVKMIPLMLGALAVAVPARVGLVNVGGEGQLYIGAWLASWAALSFSGLPKVVLLPLMLVLSISAADSGPFPAYLRARGWLNETISTLLLNYVAILFVQYFVFGAWKDPQSANFPQSKAFVPAALPTFGSYRLHAGIVFALMAVAVLYFVLRRTRWGYEMRAIGGNPEAARRAGIRVATYLIIALIVGGAMAGIAGFGEVSAIRGGCDRTSRRDKGSSASW